MRSLGFLERAKVEMIPIKSRVQMEEQQSELTQLRARVKELEEAMPDVKQLKDGIECYRSTIASNFKEFPGMDRYYIETMRKMADRIEKVIK